jgi:hypothetical protein
MYKLSQKSFNEASESIKKYARPLERKIYEKNFLDGSSKEVLDELKKYRNKDGGFGHGIESDFRLPYSSPMATSVGVRLLSEIDELKETKDYIRLAVNYLETAFNKERNGWFAVSKEVNDFPHTPWWHYNEEERMTVIDKSWGNPSAEIIAYLYKYRKYVKNLDIDSLVEFAIKYLEDKEEFNSEHEIYCYLKLYEVLPEEQQKRLEKRITAAVSQVIQYNDEKWKEYVPTPLDFVNSPDKCRYGVKESGIENNLDFLIKQLDKHGKIIPSWGESFYKEGFKPAYNEWMAVLTLNALIVLHKYGRIDK